MSELVIEASELTKEHLSNILRKRFRVLDNLNLQVARGQTYGLLGPNGAGKTTTLKVLLGLLKPTSGRVTVLGGAPGDLKALKRIGFLPENPYLYSYLTGLEFLDFCAQLFALNARERKERIAELLQIVSLTDAAKQPVRKYSKGMVQRLGIAQCLLNNPDLIFLDEPMSGLDPIGRRDMRQIMLKLKEKGKTIFLNSHLLRDVNEVCDKVGVLHKGRLIAEQEIAAISKGNYKDLEDYFMSTIAQADSGSSRSLA